MAPGALPNLLVIGAMKCGTSSMHHYLGLHPEIGMSGRKELNFFLPEQPTPLPGGGSEIELLRERSSHPRGLDWYRSQIPEAAVRGESSVAYSAPWYPEVAEIIAATLPGVRLIFLVRHPLERMTSHLAQFRDRDPRPPAEAFAAPGNPYLAASRYATSLEPYLEHFARDHILIVNADSLRTHRRRTMEAVFGFLGVDPAFYDEAMETERNRTAAKGASYRVAERLRGGRLSSLSQRLPRGLRARAERRLAGTASSPRSLPLAEALEPGLVEALLAALESETAALERITGWELPGWRHPPAPAG